MFPSALMISFLLTAVLGYKSSNLDCTLFPNTRCSSPNHSQDKSYLCHMTVLLCHKIRELKTKFAVFLLAKPVPLNWDPAQLPLHKASASFLTGGNGL